MKEIYVSVDIEADGPIPGEYSMLSLGCAALLPDKTIVDTFSANIDTLPGAKQDPETMKWWKTQQESWEACRKNTRPPEHVMKDLTDWLTTLPGKPVFVAYPASFDFMFVYWYLIRFCGTCPFSFVALDMKTFAWTLLDQGFLAVRKSSMPKHWFDTLEKTHVALEDAIEQGLMFCNMLQDREKMQKKD